mmetsp:Transcript_5348/g.6534  ORF Transcript_5348/g.6534 Transcript_5348/m.6534 type:complete len:81 (-) Transcript_5348:49-291(-)
MPGTRRTVAKQSSEPRIGKYWTSSSASWSRRRRKSNYSSSNNILNNHDDRNQLLCVAKLALYSTIHMLLAMVYMVSVVAL